MTPGNCTRWTARDIFRKKPPKVRELIVEFSHGFTNCEKRVVTEILKYETQLKHSKLKRRLRKKHHLGEFQVLGFEILVEFESNFTEADSDQFWHEFIGKIEENKLLFGGGGGSKVLQGFVTASEKYQSPTEKQREIIKTYLENLPDIAKCEVGNLKDAWYDIK